MDKLEDLQERLYQKVQKEYDNFIECLKQFPSEKIIESSYEKVFKEDLVIALREKNLSSQEVKAMLKLKYPLDALYQEWLKTDVSYMDMLSDVIDYRIHKEVKELNKNRLER